jgi:hypothetical protein
MLNPYQHLLLTIPKRLHIRIPRRLHIRIHNAFKHKWIGSGYAHPHNKENTQKAIHWARLAAKENQDTITILTIPDEEWTTNVAPYM